MFIAKRYIYLFVLVLGVTSLAGLVFFTPTQASEPAAPVIAPAAAYDCGYIVGEIRMWTGDTPPDGWLIANGQALSRSQYAGLFAVIGTRYGAGNGSTTFNLPNLNGKFPLGTGNGRVLGTSGGAETHTLTINEMPSHNHTLSRPTFMYWPGGRFSVSGSGYDEFSDVIGKHYVNNAGGGAAHNNMPPYLTVNYIIRVDNGHQQ